MAEVEVKILKRQRSYIRGKLTKINTFAHAVDSDTTLDELQTRLDRCHVLLKEFNEFEMKIFSVNPDEEGDSTIEDYYHTTVAMLTTWIRKKAVTDQVSPTVLDSSINLNATQYNLGADSELKLPKINIPKFSGNYTEWPSFFDLFAKTIHESKKLSGAQKFQYLKGLLEGEAASLLRHMLITENNYTIALAKLQERYDRKRHIITAFIRKFVDQPAIHNANATNLKRMMDVSDEVIRGLGSLGRNAEARDPWLIYLLLDKVDDKTRSSWANYSTDMDSPSIADFIKFLSRKVDAFETTASASKRTSKYELRSHVIAQGESTPSSVPAVYNPVYNCVYCSSSDHSVMQCGKFQELDTSKRTDFVRDSQRCYYCLSKSHPVNKCRSKRRCQKCYKRHHTLIHSTQTPVHPIGQNTNQSAKETPNIVSATTTVSNPVNPSPAILPTVQMKVLNSTGGFSTCRALLDSGSQVSLITNSCMQRLNLFKEVSKTFISGVGQQKSQQTTGLVQLKIMSGTQTMLPMVALVISKITCWLPTQIIAVDMKNFESVQLADPNFNKPSQVDILIGSDYLYEIMQDGVKRVQNSNLYLQTTIFGWTVAGRYTDHEAHRDDHPLALSATIDLIQLDATLRRFWEVEAINDQKIILSPEETMCESHFVEHTTRNRDGRFIVKLPFRAPTVTVGDTLAIALRRFQSLENRLAKDPGLKKAYSEFMQEYISLGHMTEITVPEIMQQSYYLPHHGVMKSSDTGDKLRVVFDGSAQPLAGNSLNNCLAVGPTVQATLFSILLRFRERKYVITTDIEKMYRQILVSDKDTYYQRIIWRDHPTSPIKHYRLLTVTYGLSSAPFLATRALKQIAIDIANCNPRLATMINEEIYVDDIMTGADTMNEVINMRDNIISIFSQYGFTLKKWKTNHQPLIFDLPHVDQEVKPKSFIENQPDNTIKILGLCWDPEDSQITFRD